MVLKFTYNQEAPTRLVMTIIITRRFNNPRKAVSCLVMIVDFIVSMGLLAGKVGKKVNSLWFIVHSRFKNNKFSNLYSWLLFLDSLFFHELLTMN